MTVAPADNGQRPAAATRRAGKGPGGTGAGSASPGPRRTGRSHSGNHPSVAAGGGGGGPRQSYYGAEMAVTHRYELTVRWTGNVGTGTSDYRGYRRDHEIHGDGKPTLLGSSDPAFRGDAARWNPQELLVAAPAPCHMPSYPHPL